MNITVRPTEASDKNVFLALMNEFYHSPAVLHPLPEKTMESCFDDSVKDSPYIKTYIFETDDKNDKKPVGFSIITIGYSSEAGGLSVWIEDVYLQKEYRSKGFGKNFLSFIEKEFKGRAKRLRLEVEKDNVRAISLYESYGFEFLPYLQMIKDL